MTLSFMTLPRSRPEKGQACKTWQTPFGGKDFTLSGEKICGYYIGTRRVLTNIFGTREVFAYVTSTEKEGGSRLLFFSTVFPAQLQIFCAWQEKAALKPDGKECLDGLYPFIPVRIQMEY